MKELKGTQTEKNLQTAFAGESQAHTKYLYYASKAKKDGYVQMGDIFEETARNEKGSMPKSGSNSFMAIPYLQRKKTSRMPLRAKNYEWTDMPDLQRLPAKRALKESQQNSKWWLPSRNTMRNATANCSRTLKTKIVFSREGEMPYGNAPTADTSLSERPLLKFVQSAPIRKAISNYWLRITNNWQHGQKPLPTADISRCPRKTLRAPACFT